MPTEKRLKFDIDGRGKKYPWPVIYIGLKRLFPMADEIKLQTSDSDLSTDEKIFYLNEVKNIMLITSNNNAAEKIVTNNKNFHGIKTDKFAAQGSSAGQDNIGQILTAILSFKTLSNKGGILLIDELEATLFPAAQINLIERLYKYAMKYRIQIIFTTHSLEIMKYVYNKKWNGVKANFLEISQGLVVNNINPKVEYIEHKIKAEAKIKIKVKKKQILCEDEAAATWIKGLLTRTELSGKIEINFKNMNDGCIKQIAESKLKCFNDLILILDGDCRNKPNFKNLKNIIFLHGNFPPEKNMFDYLKSIPENDALWTNEFLFDYNVCFNNYLEDNVTIDRCKNWYRERSRYFSKGCAKFFTH